MQPPTNFEGKQTISRSRRVENRDPFLYQTRQVAGISWRPPASTLHAVAEPPSCLQSDIPKTSQVLQMQTAPSNCQSPLKKTAAVFQGRAMTKHIRVHLLAGFGIVPIRAVAGCIVAVGENHRRAHVVGADLLHFEYGLLERQVPKNEAVTPINPGFKFQSKPGRNHSENDHIGRSWSRRMGSSQNQNKLREPVEGGLHKWPMACTAGQSCVASKRRPFARTLGSPSRYNFLVAHATGRSKTGKLTHTECMFSRLF